MKFRFSARIFFGIFIVAAVLSACVLPEKSDPFERLPESKIEVVRGTIFPFSVSISTRATHRLERDGKLVSYLASKIVNLDDFLNREVELEGFFRREKMREIFWAEKVRLLDIPESKISEKKETRFSTRKFSFKFPSNWEHSRSPDGTVYFLDKNDPARRVFFQFSAEKLDSNDKKIDPNVLISNLAGVKKISTDQFGRERQEITLFSNIFDRKYTLIFTANFEDFEKKKEFFRLLNSFVEGEKNVENAIENDKKVAAEEEAARISNLKNGESASEKTSEKKEEEMISEQTSEDSAPPPAPHCRRIL